jgi:hypothetical protein
MDITIFFVAALDAVWFINDYEDENDKVYVARRNVTNLVKLALSQGVKLDDLYEHISDHAGALCEIEDSFHDGSLEDQYYQASLRSSSNRQLSLDALVNMHNIQLKEDHFVTFAKEIATALSLNIDEDEVNAAYWTTAYDDDLSPMLAGQGVKYAE